MNNNIVIKLINNINDSNICKVYLIFPNKSNIINAKIRNIFFENRKKILSNVKADYLMPINMDILRNKLKKNPFYNQQLTLILNKQKSLFILLSSGNNNNKFIIKSQLIIYNINLGYNIINCILRKNKIYILKVILRHNESKLKRNVIYYIRNYVKYYKYILCQYAYRNIEIDYRYMNIIINPLKEGIYKYKKNNIKLKNVSKQSYFNNSIL